MGLGPHKGRRVRLLEQICDCAGDMWVANQSADQFAVGHCQRKRTDS